MKMEVQILLNLMVNTKSLPLLVMLVTADRFWISNVERSVGPIREIGVSEVLRATV